MNRIYTVKQYQAQLGYELRNADQALAVDAMDDAEEGLEEIIEDLIATGRAKDRDQALSKAVKIYGSPSAVAKEYMRRADDDERRPKESSDSAFGGVLGIFRHKETYLGMLYLLLMFPIGTLLFVYNVTVLSLGIGLAITIVGIPILILFLVSVYFIGYLLGRMTEIMLGTRMPKKRRKMYLVGTYWNRLRTILKEPRVYSSLIFTFLLFPLGITYFVVLVTFLAVSLSLIAAPLGLIFPDFFVLDAILKGGIGTEALVRMVLSLTGIVMFVWTVHLSNIMAYMHMRLARLMLLKR